MNVPKAESARLLGVSRQHLYDIMAARKPVGPEMTVRLAKMFGGKPIAWIRMQGVMRPGNCPPDDSKN